MGVAVVTYPHEASYTVCAYYQMEGGETYGVTRINRVDCDRIRAYFSFPASGLCDWRKEKEKGNVYN